ncbi:hypothetical protein NL676_006062 [Syzygium grande]|nr:hypothetical protein NL676_006062 [Syzygium grande]
MSAEGGGVAEMRESNKENSLETGNRMNETSLRSNGLPAEENGSCENTPHYGDAHDGLVQMATELKLRNEFLKLRFEGLKDLCLEEISLNNERKIAYSCPLYKGSKSIENLESQLADAASERSKATEMISSLQVLLAEKESKIAELDAASPVEAARLRAEMKSVKGEVAHLKRQLEMEASSHAQLLNARDSSCQRRGMQLLILPSSR